MPQEIAVEKFWEKMLVSTIGRNKLPPEALSVAKNARIKDLTITKRLGRNTVLDLTDIDWENQWITYNKNLFVIADQKLQEIDLVAGTETDKGTIGKDGIYNFINYWKYIIILTGDGKPRVYDWTTLTQTTTTAPDIDPIIGERFQGFTVISDNKDAKNVLYFSRPITPDNQERAYDWVGTDSEKITFDSDILGLRSTLNQLFIFTENRVEYIGKDSLATIGDSASLISTPIGDGWQAASPRSIVAAWNKVLYLTKNNTINSLNYIEWTDQPEIGIVTDKIQLKISKYLDNLDSDQSSSFGYYDDNTKTIHWHLKTIGSLYNDTVLVYDVENMTWVEDTKKLFNDVVVVADKIYAGSSITNDVIQDAVWHDDDGNAIEFEIQDTDFLAWNLKEKMFEWWECSGWLNALTKLKMTTYIDDNASSYVEILWSDYIIDEWAESMDGAIGWDSIWGTALWGWTTVDADDYTRFDKILDHSNLYKRGKRIKRNITESEVGSDFYLDLYTVYCTIKWNIELSDKF